MSESTIRLATPADEPEVMVLCRELHTENGIFSMDEARTREWIAKALQKKGGIIALIGPPGAIEAIGFLMITCYEYSTDFFLSEQFNYVRPAFRKIGHGRHLRALVEWAKQCADESQGAPLSQDTRRASGRVVRLSAAQGRGVMESVDLRQRTRQVVV